MWTLPTSSSLLINHHHPSLIFRQDIHQTIYYNEDVAHLSIHTDKSIPIQTSVVLWGHTAHLFIPFGQSIPIQTSIHPSIIWMTQCPPPHPASAQDAAHREQLDAGAQSWVWCSAPASLAQWLFLECIIWTSFSKLKLKGSVFCWSLHQGT